MVLQISESSKKKKRQKRCFYLGKMMYSLGPDFHKLAPREYQDLYPNCLSDTFFLTKKERKKITMRSPTEKRRGVNKEKRKKKKEKRKKNTKEEILLFIFIFSPLEEN